MQRLILIRSFLFVKKSNMLHLLNFHVSYVIFKLKEGEASSQFRLFTIVEIEI